MKLITLRRMILLIGLVACLAGLAWVTGSFNLRLLDFENYWHGSQMLWRGENPYHSLEFFAPPWMALFLAPLLLLPYPWAAGFWLLLNLFATGALAMVATRWLKIRPPAQMAGLAMLCMLAPGALFSAITGQVSPVVGLATVFLAWQLVQGDTPALWLALAVLVTSLKPHIVTLPVLLCLLELARRGRWRTLAWAATGVLAAVLISFVLLPDWIPSLLEAWASGEFRGGRPGLLSQGYRGLRELGIPAWAFLPYGLYILARWRREGVSPQVLALALPLNLLVIPYTRSYDLVLLSFPLVVLAGKQGARARIAFGLALLAVFVLPFTLLSVLAPVLLLATLLWGIPQGDTGTRHSS